MKKLLAILMAMAMIFAFAGCGEKEDDKKEESKPSSSQGEKPNTEPTEEAEDSDLPANPEKPTTNQKGADSLEEAIETFGDAFMDFDAKTLVTVIYGATDEHIELLEEGFAAAEDEGLKMTGYEMGEVTEITDEETIYEALVGYNADIDINDVDSFVEVEIMEELTMGDETEAFDVEVQCVEIDGRWFVIFDD